MYVLGHGEDVYDVTFVLEHLFYEVNVDKKMDNFGTVVPKTNKGIL